MPEYKVRWTIKQKKTGLEKIKAENAEEAKARILANILLLKPDKENDITTSVSIEGSGAGSDSKPYNYSLLVESFPDVKCIERETEKAYLFVCEKYNFWCPKKLIKQQGSDDINEWYVWDGFEAKELSTGIIEVPF